MADYVLIFNTKKKICIENSVLSVIHVHQHVHDVEGNGNPLTEHISS